MNGLMGSPGSRGIQGERGFPGIPGSDGKPVRISVDGFFLKKNYCSFHGKIVCKLSKISLFHAGKRFFRRIYSASLCRCAEK